MPVKKVDKPLTVLVRPELDQVLRHRADKNHRTISKEIVYLLETALGLESESVRATMHLLWKASGEPMEEATPQRG